MDVPEFSLCQYDIVQPVTFYQIIRLVPSPYTAFQNGKFMDLTVMAADLLLVITFPVWLCFRIPADASCVNRALLLELTFDPGMLRQVSECTVYRDGNAFILPF